MNFRKLACLACLAFTVTAAHAETYALLVGVGDYPETKDAEGKVVNNDLAGPINDIASYRVLLTSKFNVKPENIKSLENTGATADGFLNGLKWLIDGTKTGDQIFFVYSGHGAQVESKDSKEADGKEEYLVLQDYQLVPDDIIAQLAKLWSSSGIKSTFVFDSCFSGGMSRDRLDFAAAAVEYSINGKSIAFTGGSGRKGSKFLPYTKRLRPVSLQKVATLKMRAEAKAKAQQSTGADFAFLFAGREDQPTIDLDFKDAATPDHGLYTLIFTKILMELPDAPMDQVTDAMVEIFKKQDFDQEPTNEFSSEARASLPMLIKL